MKKPEGAGTKGRDQGNLNRPYLTEPRLERIPWLIHGFGTAAWTEADFGAVREWEGFRPVILNQVHSDVIHCLDAPPARNLEGDALITATPRLFLVIKTADCLPVLIVDEVRRVVAAVHCGWRGTRKRILEKVVGELRSRFGSDPASLVAVLGPCIGPECYEVGSDVRAGFAKAGFPGAVFRKSPVPDKFFLDLRKANVWLLETAGVPRKNVFAVAACTHCRPDLLSFRRDRDKTKRMFSFVAIRSRS